MQSAVAIPQRDMENELVKVGFARPMSGTAGWAWDPSPVLLFESLSCTELALRIMYVWPGDIFQHCASAFYFVRTFVIWSNER